MARFEAAGKKLSPEEKAKRDEHPFDAYARFKSRERQGPVPQGRRQFPLALPRPVLRGADAELLHVPPAHSQRHPLALAVRRRRRSGRALRRRLRARHHARQSADSRHHAGRRRRPHRRADEPRPHDQRDGCRQHPQCHRLAHGRHRPAGADRHPSLCLAPGTITSSTTARSTACRASSTSASTAAASSPCWRTPTTSPSRP